MSGERHPLSGLSQEKKEKFESLVKKLREERKQKSGSEGKRGLERSLTVLLEESYQSEVAWLLEAQFRQRQENKIIICPRGPKFICPSAAELSAPFWCRQSWCEHT